MSKIVKIEENKVFIGLDNGTLKEVDKTSLSFMPNVNDNVEIFETGNQVIVNKVENNNSNATPININMANVNNNAGYAVANNKPDGGTWSWIGSILLLLAGLGTISQNVLAALVYIACGLLLLPPFAKMLREKTKFTLKNGGLRFLVFFAAVMIGSAIISASNGTLTSNTSSGTTQKTNAVKEIAILNKDEEVTIDGFTVKLVDGYVTKSFAIPNENMFLERTYSAEEGKDYVLLKLKVKNTGTQSATFNGTYDSKYSFKAVGNSVYEYTMTASEEDYTFLSEVPLEPLETKTVYVFAEVPSEALTESLVVNLKMNGSEFKYIIK